jgi:peptide/nickel transport system permease protein
LALLLSYALAVPLGVLAATHKDRATDRLLSTGLFVLYSLPPFWVAVMLLLYLSGPRALDWFPIQGLTSADFASLGGWARVRDVGWHLVLPVACLSYGALASISRYTRSGMIDALSQDYVRTARAKGLTERAVVLRHALKNGVVPVVMLFGLMLPGVLGGSVLVEEIFGIHGMGLLAFEAVLNRDYPTVMGLTTWVAVLTMGSMLLSDVAHVLIDPRVRSGGAG